MSDRGDLDALPWSSGVSPATPNGAVGRRCRRHVWVSCTVDHGDAPCPDGPRCASCGRVRDAATVDRNRRNRSRGNRTSRDVAVYLGGRTVEALQLPWDVEAAGARLQVKRLAGRPSTAAIVGLVDRIPRSAAELRGLYFVAAGRRVANGRVFVLLPEWIAEHGWLAPDGAALTVAGGVFVLELPVSVFRELRRGERTVAPVRVLRPSGPISREDVDDFHGGVAPAGRPVYEPDGTVTEPEVPHG